MKSQKAADLALTEWMMAGKSEEMQKGFAIESPINLVLLEKKHTQSFSSVTNHNWSLVRRVVVAIIRSTGAGEQSSL